MAKVKDYVWRDPSGITRWATIVLAADAVLDTLTILFDLAYGGSSDYSTVATEMLTPTQYVHVGFDLLRGLLLLAGIVLVAWILRISRNAHTLTTRSLTGPWWAALWWWIIPIAAIYKPYAAMGEIWDASASRQGSEWGRRRAIGVFWAANIVRNILDQVSFRLTIFNPVVDISFRLSSLITCITLIIIARRIRDMQSEKHIANAFSDPGGERPLSVLERLNG